MRAAVVRHLAGAPVVAPVAPESPELSSLLTSLHAAASMATTSEHARGSPTVVFVIFRLLSFLRMSSRRHL